MTQSSLNGKSQNPSSIMLFISLCVIQGRPFKKLFSILVLLKITEIYINSTVDYFYLLFNFSAPL